jgi:serpin B
MIALGPWFALLSGMTKFVSYSMVLVCLLPACGDDRAANPGTPPDASPAFQPNQVRSAQARITSPTVSSADATKLAADNFAFGVDLYGQLRAANSGNFIFSQTSISLALAMLYGGAANDTATQMATALHFTLPPERLHPAFNALDLALMAQPTDAGANDFRLNIANSIWTQAGFSFLPSYLDLLAENYGAGLFVEDFANAWEAARVDVNRWVSDQTEQMIPQLFPQGSITPDTRLVLANAVFFHGDWLWAFKPGSPNGTFHAPTADVSVPMMSSSETNATLWAGTGWNAAVLRYAGGTTSMVLVVPDAGTFTAFEQGLTADSLAGILTATQAGMGYLTMPRFKFSTPSSLNQVLKALGMSDAFDAALADFSGMDGARDLSVGNVIHQAVIDVNESGTTAAAATGVTVGITAVIAPPPKVLVVDRPFLFFIRHDPTGAILFQGRVVDPSS